MFRLPGRCCFFKIDLSVVAISARLSIPGNDSRYTRWASCLGVLMMQLMLRKGWRAQVNSLGFVLCEGAAHGEATGFELGVPAG